MLCGVLCGTLAYALASRVAAFNRVIDKTVQEDMHVDSMQRASHSFMGTDVHDLHAYVTAVLRLV